MESILRTISLEPMELTYLGIGSSPHINQGQVLEPRYDQLIPQCFHEFLLRDKKHIRILHFDPAFEHYVEFLNEYFSKWGLIPMEFSEGMSWIGENIEVIVISKQLNHNEHFWFFQSLCEIILHREGKLVIQEYTGYELKKLNEELYDACENKELFKRRILLDMTYETDTGCCTDMTKAQPFYDYNSDFLNFHFMTDEDALRWANVSLKVNTILKKKYIKKFLQTLNDIHVDYRRRLKGDPCMFSHTLYTNDSTPDEIMKILEVSISVSFEILLVIQHVEKEAEAKMRTLFLTYKECDPYKWYDSVRKLISGP